MINNHINFKKLMYVIIIGGFINGIFISYPPLYSLDYRKLQLMLTHKIGLKYYVWIMKINL